MEARKWENLNSDCLANVFGRLDLESLLLDVPLVCKQWYQALVNPFCWQKLVFPLRIYQSRLADHAFECGGSFNISRLIKFVVGRSNGCATTLMPPWHITKEDLIYVSDVCPSLKVLALPYTLPVDNGDTISELIVKWKSLEVLILDGCYLMLQIIDKIGLYCKNFVELTVEDGNIDEEVASAIVSKLATLKRLVLDESHLEKDNLVLILRGCKGLELLYVRNCVGFDQDDEEILMLASRIKDFRCAGSTTETYDHAYEYYREKYDYDNFDDDILYGAY